MMGVRTRTGTIYFVGVVILVLAQSGARAQSGKLLTGKAAIGDWTSDAPGVRRKITHPRLNVFTIPEPCFLLCHSQVLSSAVAPAAFQNKSVPNLDLLVGRSAGLLETPLQNLLVRSSLRSEERRVGKECRSRWSPYH